MSMHGGRGGGDRAGGKKNDISPYFDGSGNKNIGATLRIGREIRCLPYEGFFLDPVHCTLYHGLAINTEITVVSVTLLEAGPSGGGPAVV